MQNGKFGIIFDNRIAFSTAHSNKCGPLLNLGPAFIFFFGVNVVCACIMLNVCSISLTLSFDFYLIHGYTANLNRNLFPQLENLTK